MTQAHHKEFYNTKISIHIPLARYDLSGDYLDMLKPISIHIPLARYDRVADYGVTSISDFNPHILLFA